MSRLELISIRSLLLSIFVCFFVIGLPLERSFWRAPSSYNPQNMKCSAPVFRKQSPFYISELWNEKVVNTPGLAGDEFSQMNSQVKLNIDLDTSITRALYPGSFVTYETLQEKDGREFIYLKTHSSMNSKAREKFLKYLQASRATEEEYLENHNRILESHEKSVGLTFINGCPDKDNCDPLKLIDSREMIFEVREDHEYEDPYTGELYFLKKGELLEFVKSTNESPLQRNCQERLRSGQTYNHRSFFFRKMQDSDDQKNYQELQEVRHLVEDRIFLEFTYDSLSKLKIAAILKNRYKILNALSKTLTGWELSYEVGGEFSGVRLKNSRRYFAHDLFYIEDMDLVQIPSGPVNVDGYFYGKSAFGSYHYILGKAHTLVEDNDIRNPSNHLVRELARDSFLEPYAACTFLGFLENYQRECFFEKLNNEKEHTDITMEPNLSQIQPFECDPRSPDGCYCTPLRWGDMFQPKGLHKSHDSKNCVDIRAFRVDGQLGPTRESLPDTRANIRLVKQLCRSGATTIGYNYDVARLNQELRREGLECRVKQWPHHEYHFHVCFAEELEADEFSTLETYCKHPKALNEMRRLSQEFYIE